MPAEPVPVEVTSLSKSYGDVVAVDDLSFTVEPGTIAGFLGPNGAGKTTTLRVIGGLLRPTAGGARLFGRDAWDPVARRPLAYMPADPVFLPHLSGTANLDLLVRLRGAEHADDRAHAAEVLDLGPAALARPVGGYSSGMRQKLAIIATLQCRPELVVLDEPANRLDPIAHRAFCSLVREIAEAGRAVLLSSHVLAEVEEVCDSVILIRGGRLLTISGVDELRRQASRDVTIVYRSAPAQPPAALTAARVDGVTVTGRMPARRPDLVRSLLDDPDIVDVTVAPASLEDVFFDFYRDGPC